MSESQRSAHYTNVRLADETHGRLKAHNRRGENLSGTVARALDALEREDKMPAVVSEFLRADVPAEIITDGENVLIFDVTEWDADELTEFKRRFERDFVED